MGKKRYFNKKDLEQAVHGNALEPPKDMVRPEFKPLNNINYKENDVFYENEKLLVLKAPVCDSHKLIAALNHKPCESDLYLAKLLERDGAPQLIISLDTEYEELKTVAVAEDIQEFEDGLDIKTKKKKKKEKNNNHRKVLSYQTSCYYNGEIIRLIFFSKTTELLDVSDILHIITPNLKIPAIRYAKQDSSTNETKLSASQPKLDVVFLAYNALADITTMNDFPKMANTFAKSADLLSLESYNLTFNKNNAYYYDCQITVIGVQNHVPGGLKELGDGIQMPKIQLPQGVISQMENYREQNFDKFLEYGINDSDICLLWYLLNFKDMEIPISSPALGAKIIEDAIAGDCETKEERKQKVLEWRGLRINKILTTDAWYNRASYMKVTEEAVSDLAEKIFLEASNAYAGGMNQCMIPGFYRKKTLDVDLCGCYPTAGALLRDPDYSAEISMDMLYKKDITYDYLEKYDFQTYGFGTVKFDFPEYTTFPCIAQSDGNNGLIFTRKSDRYVQTTWPEVRMALLMGARVIVGEFYFYNSKKDENGSHIYTLRKAFKKMSHFRKLAKSTYATPENPKPIQETSWKLANNGSYGKISQNCSAKKSRSVKYDKTVELGPSSITSPAHAAYITALPRILLCAVMEQLTQKGYNCYSVTTDGFITDATQDIINSCDGYGLVKLFSEARKYLVDNPKVWEVKHKQNYLLNITTRVNQGYNDMETGVTIKNETVNAHVGFKVPKNRTEEEKKELPDEALFTYEYLNNYEKGVTVTVDQLPNLNEVVRRKSDYVPTETTCTLKYNFDFKRKPDSNKYEEKFHFRGKEYYTINYNTVPFEDFDEYLKYKNAKNKVTIIRDFKDYVQIRCQVEEEPLKIPTLDEQVRAAISHLRLTANHRLVLDKLIKYKNLEYTIAVITGTIRKSLDAYMKYYKDDCIIEGIENYQADFLTPKTWPNFAKKQRFNYHNYLGYAEWVEKAIMYRLNRIIEKIENDQ